MASYLVLEPDATPASAEEAVIIRDGFAFWAFLVPFLWFLWHRMWLEALAALTLAFVLAGLGMLPGFEIQATLISLLLSFLIGLEARALRVAALQRRDWRMWGVVEARDRHEAEIRYAAEAAPAERPAAAPPPVPPARRAGTQQAKPSGPSFGLLDYPRRN